MRRRVAITGIGAISPNGVGASAFAQACLEGKSGLSRPDFAGSDRLKTSAVGAVRGFDPLAEMSPVEARRVPRLVPMALAASRQALSEAGLPLDPGDLPAQRKVGVVLGTGGGGLAFVEEQYRQYFAGGQASLFSITAGTHGNLSSELSIALHLRGPSHLISTGCASSTDALGYAAMLIRCGVVPVVLAGGADAPISPGILHAFEKMKVVSTRYWDDPRRASRPFSADRDGFVLGEGAWMFVLEDLDHAVARGARPLAELCGYGSTCDAFHRVQIAPDLTEPVRAIELALSDAGITVGQLGYVNLHGTGTEMNDRLETRALRLALGPQADRVPMSATKSMIGHPQGACGAAGVAATILCLRRGWAHPTINLERPDPECDLDYIPGQSRRCLAEYALCNCIAFGSKNSVLVLRIAPGALQDQPEAAAPATSQPPGA
ncbi:MAG: beta-ketoacyl-[acyl-carrier-protein] synthase family protein [Phycisphaerae bacterium]|nr:beta-ketoacyl-[acyl-carrier-protein] synthase family protein [Phycisphaerae bacterium]